QRLLGRLVGTYEQPRRTIRLLERVHRLAAVSVRRYHRGNSFHGDAGIDSECKRQPYHASAGTQEVALPELSEQGIRSGVRHECAAHYLEPPYTLDDRRRERRRRQTLAVALQLQDSARLRIRSHQIHGE